MTKRTIGQRDYAAEYAARLRQARADHEHIKTSAEMAAHRVDPQAHRLDHLRQVVRQQLNVAGLTIRYAVGDREYRVNFRGGCEATAYYTNDLNDALDTGLAMAIEGNRHVCGPECNS